MTAKATGCANSEDTVCNVGGVEVGIVSTHLRGRQNHENSYGRSIWRLGKPYQSLIR